MSLTLSTSYEVYKKLTSEVNMLEETLDNLSVELEKLEDTWVEATPIIGCFQTSVDVVKHILKEKRDSKKVQWKIILELREEQGV